MPDSSPIVYVVDDDILAREALTALIHKAGWEPRAFASAEEIPLPLWRFCPCCLIFDVCPPGLNGLRVQERIVRDQMNVPIIFTTKFSDSAMIVRAMKAGAMEFLVKPCKEEVLLQAIRSALDRSIAMQGATREIQVLRERYASLSTREREVMAGVVFGLMNKVVGGELGISEITVKAHRGRVMRKMKASSLAELVNFASKLDLPRLASRRMPVFVANRRTGESAPLGHRDCRLGLGDQMS